MAINLLVCCHSRLLAEGIKVFLEAEDDMEITCIFSDTPLTAKTIQNFDVVLSDFDYFMDFTELLLYNARSRILLLYNTKRSQYVAARIPELFHKGLAGIITSDSDESLLIKAVRKVSSGELWLNRSALKSILTQNVREKVSLTKQEKLVGSYIFKAYRNKEIAQKLGISEQTVKSHCNRIYKKLGITDRLQLAMYWQRQGLDVEVTKD